MMALEKYKFAGTGQCDNKNCPVLNKEQIEVLTDGTGKELFILQIDPRSGAHISFAACPKCHTHRKIEKES